MWMKSKGEISTEEPPGIKSRVPLEHLLEARCEDAHNLRVETCQLTPKHCLRLSLTGDSHQVKRTSDKKDYYMPACPACVRSVKAEHFSIAFGKSKYFDYIS